MSGCPRCASVAPSQSATSACTIDCGCTTTSIRSYGVPNSQCASITSRPLFISVAESIVILPPIAQVGWRSACSTVDVRELVAAAAAERAARGGQRQALDRPRPLARDQLVQRRVLGVDRDQLRAGRLGERHHELAADDERLLVGERDVDPLGQRDDRRAEAGGADDRVEHEVGVRSRRRAARAPRARRAPRPRSTPRPPAPPRPDRSARSASRRARAPARPAPRASAPRTGRRARTPRARARRRRAPACRSSRSRRGSGAASSATQCGSRSPQAAAKRCARVPPARRSRPRRAARSAGRAAPCGSRRPRRPPAARCGRSTRARRARTARRRRRAPRRGRSAPGSGSCRGRPGRGRACARPRPAAAPRPDRR